MTEKQFQSMVVKLFKLNGYLCYHTHNSRRSQPGFPDLVLAHPQRGVLFAELKTEKGKVSRDQEEWLTTLRAGGVRVYLWRPSDWHEIEGIASADPCR